MPATDVVGQADRDDPPSVRPVAVVIDLGCELGDALVEPRLELLSRNFAPICVAGWRWRLTDELGFAKPLSDEFGESLTIYRGQERRARAYGYEELIKLYGASFVARGNAGYMRTLYIASLGMLHNRLVKGHPRLYLRTLLQYRIQLTNCQPYDLVAFWSNTPLSVEFCRFTYVLLTKSCLVIDICLRGSHLCFG